MISLHAGRLLLTCERASQTWHARINIGPKPEHQMVVDTGTVDLRQAMERGNMHYQAFRAKVRPVTPDAPAYCTALSEIVRYPAVPVPVLQVSTSPGAGWCRRAKQRGYQTF